MKKTFFLSSLIAGLGLIACSDDIGNYNYTDINEVSIDTEAPGCVEEGKTYEFIAYVDKFNFDPKINSTFGITDESAYEYEWRVIPQSADWNEVDESKITIARTRKLDFTVNLPPRRYSAFFNVTDKSTGVTWTTQFNLQISSLTNEGWLVLCNEDDKCRLDLIYNRNATEDIVSRDILQNKDELGKPERILFSRYTTNIAETMLVTDKDTYCLDHNDLHAGEDNSLRWRFGNSSHPVRIKASAISNYSGSGENLWVVIDENDDVYTLAVGTDGAFFEYPVSLIQGQEAFTPAPFVCVNVNQQSFRVGMQACHPAVLYDADHRQFVQMQHNSAYPVVMDFKGDKIFDNPTGKDMLHMESCRHGEIKAALRDPSTHETYYYSMTLHGEEKEGTYWWSDKEYIGWNVQEGYGKIIGPNVENATKFAFHYLFPYVFYVADNTVYQFNMSTPDRAAVPVLSFPDEEIALIKFVPFMGPFLENSNNTSWQYQRNYQLIVATNKNGMTDDKCGIVRFYEVPDLMRPLVEIKKFDEFGRIVDIVYKERRIA